ncbi:hypothetical protein BHE74_00008280 [Ensete ventricosum]|nr:hypothetical protein GW17_00011134 [Ensete ventricosum]RWW83220.1 hypothetical protein BHE74_00008280 [Ensete ventricosum]RZS02040.1 hypothetical protein BHM03_00032013 [Ensete ventricosum]
MSSCLSLMIRDKKGRVHKLEISLSRNYPESSPTIAAVSSDAPCINEVVWSEKSRLKDVVQQFNEVQEALHVLVFSFTLLYMYPTTWSCETVPLE